MNEDYWYLCCNCGGVSRADRWLNLDLDDGKLVPASRGKEPTFIRCPACRHDHVDDDSNPGIFDGTYAEVQTERVEAAKEWADHWADLVA